MPDPNRYSAISTINHWITALLVIAMLTLGYALKHAPSDATEDYILGIHISLGFFVFFIVLWRVLVRVWEGFPAATEQSALERRIAYFVHRGILLLLVLLVITGPLYLFTENECMSVFGWFALCVSLESLAILHEPAEWLHVNSGLYLLPALLLLHLLGAVRHYSQGERKR